MEGPCPCPKAVSLANPLAEQLPGGGGVGGGGGCGTAAGVAASQLASSVVRSHCAEELRARFVMKKRKFGYVASEAASAV